MSDTDELLDAMARVDRRINPKVIERLPDGIYRRAPPKWPPPSMAEYSQMLREELDK